MFERQHWLKLKNGEPRFSRSWWPNSDPRAVVCIIPGLGEHTGRYHDLAAQFLSQELGVVSIDLQGQGLSPGKRGCIESYDSLLQDVESAIHFARSVDVERLASDDPKQPSSEELNQLKIDPARKIILYGHSMGGNLVLNAVLRNVSSPNGVVSSSPMLRAVQPMSDAYLKFARFMMRLFPNFQLKAPVKSEYLTRDQSQKEKYEKDDLVHRRVSLRLGASLIDSGQWALDHAQELSVPLLILHGMQDQITDPHASQEFAKNSNSYCHSRFFPNLLHDTHRDVGREGVFETIFEWMQSRAGVPLP